MIFFVQTECFFGFLYTFILNTDFLHFWGYKKDGHPVAVFVFVWADGGFRWK